MRGWRVFAQYTKILLSPIIFWTAKCATLSAQHSSKSFRLWACFCRSLQTCSATWEERRRWWMLRCEAWPRNLQRISCKSFQTLKMKYPLISLSERQKHSSVGPILRTTSSHLLPSFACQASSFESLASKEPLCQFTVQRNQQIAEWLVFLSDRLQPERISALVTGAPPRRFRPSHFFHSNLQLTCHWLAVTQSKKQHSLVRLHLQIGILVHEKHRTLLLFQKPSYLYNLANMYYLKHVTNDNMSIFHSLIEERVPPRSE